MAHISDQHRIRTNRGLPRFLLRQQQIAWVALASCVLWGVFGYIAMPQRKDPDIPIRMAMVNVSWPGAGAEQIEQLVAKPVEDQIAQNTRVHEIRTTIRKSVASIIIELVDEKNYDVPKELDDIKLHLDQFHDLPAGAGPIQFIKDFGDTSALMLTVASPTTDKYSYRDLDDFSDQIAKSLQTLEIVSKVQRFGAVEERVYLDYSQEKLARYGINPGDVQLAILGHNVDSAGPNEDASGRRMSVQPTGRFQNADELQNLLVPAGNGRVVYLRDLADVKRQYVSPADYLNTFTRRDGSGRWITTRSVTLSVNMRTGQQMARFGQQVDDELARVRKLLPADLVYARTADQPRQVSEQIQLFMRSLTEAVVLVILVSMIGFWDWRPALIMAFAIVITLCITFGLMHTLNVDLQQVSIASLIVALGLLVDVPVVSADAIERELASGKRPLVAAWLGPTKLFTAMLFATVTNIAAYLPFRLLPGDTGRFLSSLSIVITASLLASLLVAMSFVPLIAVRIARAKKEPPIEQRRRAGFSGAYYRVGAWAIEHRKLSLALSLLFIVAALFIGTRLKPQFFPTDLQYLSWVDVWLPEDASVAETQRTAAAAEEVIRQTAEQYGRIHGTPKELLRNMTTFLGGCGPRFWMSAQPEPRKPNYAQILIETADKRYTHELTLAWQKALDRRIAGARVDVRELETGSPVGVPIQIRISGNDTEQLLSAAERLKAIFRAVPFSARVHDDWGVQAISAKVKVDEEQANRIGVTNADVAMTLAAAYYGQEVGQLHAGDKSIPILMRLRPEDRAEPGDIRNLYVFSRQPHAAVPLPQVAKVEYGQELVNLVRFNHFRAVTVKCFPQPGHLSSEVLASAMAAILDVRRMLPPGVRLEIAGEYKEQVKGFKNLSLVLAISVALIYLALMAQFRNAIKPLIVFAAIPYGIMGALIGLWVMNIPFGFMSFFGLISLVGVIVSHIIVLFDLIEERREEGESLKTALLDAGILRLRPVMITVMATVFALIPLAHNGGPLWEPLCFAQIGGLLTATFVTLLLVPVLYSILAVDLKIVRWDASNAEEEPQSEQVGTGNLLELGTAILTRSGSLPRGGSSAGG